MGKPVKKCCQQTSIRMNSAQFGSFQDKINKIYRNFPKRILKTFAFFKKIRKTFPKNERNKLKQIKIAKDEEFSKLFGPETQHPKIWLKNKNIFEISNQF